jgi:HlyD family secretion protein
VQVFADGAREAVAGKVSFISPRAEYTPPVIYSRENRSKFVFMVEALFEAGVAERLHPGQPVDVRFSIVAAQ